MKKAVVLVEKCMECPFCKIEINPWNRTFYDCKKLSKRVEPLTLDAECPLEDAEKE